jgi:peptidoglycan/LPS O-acetylase OafA/YrhL
MTPALPAKDSLLDAKSFAAHGRLPQLDGLRAVAVLMVLVHHTTDHFAIGWVGVHLFFVLSGFLITGVLWREREDNVYWGPFYLKRATRILPPLVPFFIACILTIPIAWKTTGLAYIFFGANIVLSLPNAPITALSVLWSLAVEEHFYLIWPFAVRSMSRRMLIGLLAAVMVVEPIARGLATHHVWGFRPIYQLTYFQLDGLAAGALLAFLLQEERCIAWLRRYAGRLALLSGTLFVACSLHPAFARENNSELFNFFGYTLVVLTFAFTLAYVVAKSDSKVSALLSARPMVFVGAISYGMYLYAWLVMNAVLWAAPVIFHRWRAIGLFKVLLTWALTIAVSWVSFRLYESPITRWGRRKARTLSLRGGKRGSEVRAVVRASGVEREMNRFGISRRRCKRGR